MILIYCSENCIHQTEGFCTFSQVGSISNTTSMGCEFYTDKKKYEDTKLKV